MSSALIHAQRSAERWGGQAEDYLPVHEFLDQTKVFLPDNRHRMLLHNELGISLAVQVFGLQLMNWAGEQVFIREIAEQHIIEDLGFVPSVAQCLESLPIEPWMAGAAKHLKDALAADQAPAESAVQAPAESPPQKKAPGKSFSRRAFLGAVAATPAAAVSSDAPERPTKAWTVMAQGWHYNDEYTYPEGDPVTTRIFYDKAAAEDYLAELNKPFFEEWYPNPEDFEADFEQYELDEEATWDELFEAGHPRPYYLEEVDLQ